MMLQYLEPYTTIHATKGQNETELNNLIQQLPKPFILMAVRKPTKVQNHRGTVKPNI